MGRAYNQAATGGFSLDPAYRQALNPALAGAGDPQGVRDRFQSALAPARLEFERTLQDVGQRYGDTWGASGALPEMASRATAEYGSNLNALLGELTYNDQQSARNRQLQGVQSGMQLQGMENQGIGNLYSMGEANRGLQGEQNMSDYARWMSGQWYNNPALGLLGPLLGTQAHAIGTQQGVIPGMASGLGGLAGMAGMFL